MPEGHTIHRIAQDHTSDFVGQELAVSSPQGRFAAGAKTLDGRRLEAVEAHGKHLGYRWSGGKLLHVHLGLYGKFRGHKTPPPEPRGQVRLRVVGDSKAFDLNGPSRCELLTKTAWSQLRSRLGEDPLRADSDPQAAWRRVGRSRAAIGTLLLNQSVIAGVGNVYRSEVLFLLGIHPETPGNALGEERFYELWRELERLLAIGVRFNRIIIPDPEEVGKPRSRMSREERLRVYKRSSCVRCAAAIKSWTLGGRTAYACPRCQRLGRHS